MEPHWKGQPSSIHLHLHDNLDLVGLDVFQKAKLCHLGSQTGKQPLTERSFLAFWTSKYMANFKDSFSMISEVLISKTSILLSGGNHLHSRNRNMDANKWCFRTGNSFLDYGYFGYISLGEICAGARCFFAPKVFGDHLKIQNGPP